MNQATQVLAAVMLAVISVMWVLIGVFVTVRSEPAVDDDYYFRYEGVRFDGHSDRILGVGVSPDGRRLVSYSMDRTVRVWDAHTGTCLWMRQGTFEKAEFSRDGSLVVGSHGPLICTWDAATGR